MPAGPANHPPIRLRSPGNCLRFSALKSHRKAPSTIAKKVIKSYQPTPVAPSGSALPSPLALWRGAREAWCPDSTHRGASNTLHRRVSPPKKTSWPNHRPPPQRPHQNQTPPCLTSTPSELSSPASIVATPSFCPRTPISPRAKRHQKTSSWRLNADSHFPGLVCLSSR
jgi:hypothetical protein